MLREPARRRSRGTFRHEAENRAALASTSQVDPQLGRGHRHRLEAPAAGAQEPAVERVQVHRAGRRAAARVAAATAAGAPDHPVLAHAPTVVAFEVADTGIGIPPEKQQHHLRGVPAGRRRHQPQVRRHRPRPRDQPRAREPARRRDPAAQRAGRGQHVHALPAADATSGRRVGRAAESQPSAAAPRRRSPAVARRRSAPIEPIAGRPRATSSPGDAVLLIVEDDPHYARVLVDLARDQGFKVLVAMRGADALALARAVPADGGLARRLPARHARLDGAQPAQAGPGDAAHPGADRHARRGPPARPRARRVLAS